MNRKNTKLYERMTEDMQLKGFSPRTQESYLLALRRLHKHFDHKPLDKITEEEIRQYFLHRLNVDKWAKATCKIALCGIKFFYETTLKWDWAIVGLATPKRDHKLPVVLSQSEVRTILKKVRFFRHYATLATLYSCGLRLSEGCHLQVKDIQSKRGFLHVTGKGSHDRYVPVPARTIEILRINWARHRNPVWLFPATGQGGKDEFTATKPVPIYNVQWALRDALKSTNIAKKVTPHTLRHSYATHLLEMGVNLRIIQQWLGHASPATTMIYTQLTEPAISPAMDIINKMMNDI